MNKAMLAVFALTAAVASPLVAQSMSDTSTVEAGGYKIDSSHTLVLFSINHFGFNDYFGILPGATGTMTLDPKALAKTTLDVTVPIGKLSTTNTVLDGELKSADWFDAAKYPQAHFVSTSVAQTGPGTADITGNLTLHGVTKPVVLAATFGGGGLSPITTTYTIGFKATAQIKRSDFEVRKYLPLVGDNVTLTITAAFEKAG